MVHTADKAIVVIIALTGGWIADGIARRFSGAAQPHRPAWLTVAVVAMALWSYWAAPPPLLLPTCGLGWALITLAAVDLSVMRLPNAITLPLIALGFLIAIWSPEPPLLDRVIGAAAGYGVFAGMALLYRRLRGRDGLGLGDAKLAAAAGAWLGWATLPVFILLACLGGIAWGGLRMVRSRDSFQTPLPFGLPLAGAFWLMWLYAPAIAPLP